jgi:hypothetical protein
MRFSAVLPRLAAPRLAARFAGAGDRVEAPQFLAGSRLVGGDEAPDAVLGAADADDDFVLHDERGQRDRIRVSRIGDGDIPERLAVFRVNRDEVRVERAHEQRVAKNGDAAVVGAAADALVGGVRVPILPEDASGLRVEREHVIGALRHVHQAVGDDR